MNPLKGAQNHPGLDEVHYEAYVQQQRIRAANRERVMIMNFEQWKAYERIRELQKLGEG